jgi:hypothetical protein
MTDRELWVKTMKTVGAMVGGTVVFLGSMSLVLMLVVGGRAATTSEAQHGSAGPALSSESKGPEATPPARGPRRGMKGEARPTEPRPGESI